MAVEILASIIPAALKLLEGIGAKGASTSMAQNLRAEQLSMPQEEIQAGQIASMLATEGMPGLENYKEQINNLLPQTANAMKETSSSPSTMIDMMSKALSETDKQYNNLATENANFHLGTMQNYQNALSHKANMGLDIQKENITTNKEAIMQEGQGTKDLFQSFENAGGSFLDTYAQMKKLGYEKEFYDSLKNYFGK